MNDERNAPLRESIGISGKSKYPRMSTAGPARTPSPVAANNQPIGSGLRSFLIITIARTIAGATAANILRYVSIMIN